MAGARGCAGVASRGERVRATKTRGKNSALLRPAAGQASSAASDEICACTCPGRRHQGQHSAGMPLPAHAPFAPSKRAGCAEPSAGGCGSHAIRHAYSQWFVCLSSARQLLVRVIEVPQICQTLGRGGGAGPRRGARGAGQTRTLAARRPRAGHWNRAAPFCRKFAALTFTTCDGFGRGRLCAVPSITPHASLRWVRSAKRIAASVRLTASS